MRTPALADAISIKTMSEPNFDLKVKRFVTTSEEDKQKLLDGRLKTNTKLATKSNLKALTDYLLEKDLKTFDQFTTNELPDLLENFYSDYRKNDGDIYKIQSLKCMRAGINSSGGSRISRRGGVDPLGGRGPPTWVLFGKNVCENERIWSSRGSLCPARPLDPPMNRYTKEQEYWYYIRC